MKFFAVIFSFLMSSVSAQLPKPVVIMLAVNYSAGEIEAAKRAALARGEDLIVIPEQTKEVVTAGELGTQKEVYQLHVLKPALKAGKASVEIWKPFYEMEKKLGSALESFQTDPQRLQKELKSTIKRLTEAHIPIDSLIISGHDGGGNFGGEFGNIYYFSISEFASQYPEFKNSLRSVYLLGCYTSTPFEVRNWKLAFPHMELVAGAEMKGLLRNAPEGWTLLEETMKKERDFVRSKDAASLNAIVAKTRYINKIASGIAVFPSCDHSEKEYYRGSLTHNTFALHAPDFCERSAREFEANNDLYFKYGRGEIAIPEDTSHSPLRDLYTFYRLHEQCNTPEHNYGPSGDDAMFMVFNRNMRENFSSYFSSDIQKLQASIDELRKSNDSARLFEASKIISALKEPKEFSNMSLKKVLELSFSMNEEYKTLNIIDEKTANAWEKLSTSLNNMVIQHQGIPFSWHERPEQKIEAPLQSKTLTPDR